MVLALHGSWKTSLKALGTVEIDPEVLRNLRMSWIETQGSLTSRSSWQGSVLIHRVRWQVWPVDGGLEASLEVAMAVIRLKNAQRFWMNGASRWVVHRLT